VKFNDKWFVELIPSVDNPDFHLLIIQNRKCIKQYRFIVPNNKIKNLTWGDTPTRICTKAIRETTNGRE